MIYIREGTVDHTSEQTPIMKMPPGAEMLSVEVLGKLKSGYLAMSDNCPLQTLR
jgi:hypothetical protein